MASLLWLKWGGGNSIEQTWHLTKKWCRQMPASIKNRCHFTWFQRIPPSYLECQVLFGSSPHGFYFVSFSRFPACGFMCFEPFAFLVAFLCLPFVFSCFGFVCLIVCLFRFALRGFLCIIHCFWFHRWMVWRHIARLFRLRATLCTMCAAFCHITCMSILCGCIQTHKQACKYSHLCEFCWCFHNQIPWKIVLLGVQWCRAHKNDCAYIMTQLKT